jgi:hypothetical protein
MLSYQELFLNNNTSFSRLPLWVQQSKLINLIYNNAYDPETDEMDDEWWNTITNGPATIKHLNILWNIISTGAIDLLNEHWLDVYNAANYLDMPKAQRELCSFMITSEYYGPLSEYPDHVWQFIMYQPRLMMLWWNTFKDDIFTVVHGKDDCNFLRRLWHPKLFWDGKLTRRPHMCNALEADVGTALTHWHDLWDELDYPDTFGNLEPFLWSSGIFYMMGILPLTYSQCPITQWVVSTTVDHGIGTPTRPPPSWMRNLLAAMPQLVWNCDKLRSNCGWKLSPIREWIGSGHVPYVQAFCQYVPKDLLLDGLSLVDYAAMQDADQQIIDALFINGHRATPEVWGYVLSIAVHKRRFIGKWSFWLSSAEPMPRMPNVVRAMFQDIVACHAEDRGYCPGTNWRTIYHQVANLLQAHDFKYPFDNTILDIERLTL